MTKPLSGVGGAPNLGSVMLNARTTPAAEPPPGKAVVDVVNGRPGSRINGEARKPLAFNAEAQPLARWLVADATALAALSVTADDVGYVARQASPLAFYRLVSTGPAVWELVGGGAAGGGTRTRGTWAARPVSPAVGDYYEVTDVPRTELRCWSAGTWSIYYDGIAVVGASTSGLPTAQNMGSSTFVDVGPFAVLTPEASASLTLLGRTTTVALSPPYAVELAVVGDGGFGLMVMDASPGNSYMMHDGDLNRTAFQVRLFDSAFNATGTLLDWANMGRGLRIFRAHVLDASTVRWEWSHDGARWHRFHETTFTPNRVGFGAWRNSATLRSAMIVHFRQYVP